MSASDVFRSIVTPARIAAFAAVFAFGVIVFGAFVRLSDAGLSCPDWPTCYGKATWPGHEHDIAHANAAFPDRPFETHKAWREQVHRMLAGTLGVLVLALAVAAAWRRRALARDARDRRARGRVRRVPVHAAGVRRIERAFARRDRVAAVRGDAARSPGAVARRGRRARGRRVPGDARHVDGHAAAETRRRHGPSARRPADVRAAFVRRARADRRRTSRRRSSGTCNAPSSIGLVLLACQIALGGWTSANYAALACGFDFPQCQGQWWPPTDFREGFVLWRGIGVNYEGGVLDAPARAAIQIAHRIGALVVFCYLGWLRASPRARAAARACASRSARCCCCRSRSASAMSSLVCRCRLRRRTTASRRCCCSR